MGVTSILDTAKQALLAQQAALHVVGQNVANVNTPGYTRERAVMVSTEPSSFVGALRGGVTVDRIERLFDQYITAQRNVATANFQSAQEQADQLGRAEILVNDLGLEDSSVSSNLERFFQAFQGLANKPQGIPERTEVQQQGNHMVAAFHDLHTGFQDLRRDLNNALKDDLSEVNRLASEIADLNVQIQGTEANPKNPAGALRDQRDEFLRQLSEKVGVTAFESNGDLTVLLGSGRPLIEGARFNSLISIDDPDDPQNVLVRMQDPQGNVSDVSNNIMSGKIHGLLSVKDTLLPGFIAKLDRLAAQLTSSVNQLHSNGYGLDGSTGNNFFVPRQVSGQDASSNAGGGTLQSVSVFDPTQLTLDDYQIRFAANGPPPTFDIVNTTTGSNVATAQPYTSGASIRFAGIEVVMTDGSGIPQAGDTFSISSTKSAAKNIAVDPVTQNAPEKIAAATTPEAGDNTNALSLAGLRDAQVISGNTFGESYSALVSSVGAEKQNSSSLSVQRELVVAEIENRRESVSGISLDEEQIDLIRFQQAFAAAANFVRVADEMADIVVNLVR